MLHYNIIVEKSPDGEYWGSVRELPGCFSCGATVEELAANVREAIALHLEEVEEEPIPENAHLMQVAL